MSLKQRSLALLHTARFVTFATQCNDHSPWASTVEPRILLNPLRFIWFSCHQSQHSQNIRQNPQVSGSLFRYDLIEYPEIGLDGAQFIGHARELSDEECISAYSHYYQLTPFDDTQHLTDMIPLEQLQKNGHSRFYQVDIEQFWLVDIESWVTHKENRRVSVPLSYLNDE
ncbi:TPA: pyridoxamine 5'-phosphate oxidase family protein [Providencia alcalifaciens]